MQEEAPESKEEASEALQGAVKRRQDSLDAGHVPVSMIREQRLTGPRGTERSPTCAMTVPCCRGHGTHMCGRAMTNRGRGARVVTSY